MAKTNFTEGDPAQQIAATIVTDDWLNKMQLHRHDGLDQDGSCPLEYSADTGAANALVVAFDPVFTAYITGLPLRVKVAATNTGAATLAVDGMAAKALKKFGSADLEPGDLVAGDIITVVYDGVNFQLQTPGHRIYGRKNKIVNGDFSECQRSTPVGPFTNTANFGPDRWKGAATGSSLTLSQQAFISGQGDEQRYYARCVVASVAGAGNSASLSQKIESVRTLAGKTVCVTFKAKADAPKSMSVELYQNFGTGGAPSNGVSCGGQKVGVTAAWEPFTLKFSVPSIADKTLGSNKDDNLQLLFWMDAGSNYDSRTEALGNQSGTFEISEVRLEEGPVATAGGDSLPGGESLLCKRFTERITCQFIGFGTAATKKSFATKLTPKRAAAAAVTFTDGAGNVGKISTYDTNMTRTDNVSLGAGDTISMAGVSPQLFYTAATANTYHGILFEAIVDVEL